MASYVSYRMRITMVDSRTLIGTFLAYDKYMNIILADSEEFRKVWRAYRRMPSSWVAQYYLPSWRAPLPPCALAADIF